jgi:membrane protein required for colicin V production
MNALDIFVIGVIVLSGLLAFARGFVKESLSIVAWLGATAAAIYALPFARPIAERYLPQGAVAEAAAAGTVFIVTLIVLSILTGGIARSVRGSALSALDRTLGLIFGLMRGALLVCIGYIALSFVLPQNGQQPRWISESRTLPLVASVTDSLSRLLPESFRRQATRLTPAGKLDSDYLTVLRAYSVPGAKGGGALPAIAPEDQKRLNQLIEQLGSGAAPPPAPGKMIEVPQAR